MPRPPAYDPPAIPAGRIGVVRIVAGDVAELLPPRDRVVAFPAHRARPPAAADAPPK